jgi:hypothetical protein
VPNVELTQTDLGLLLSAMYEKSSETDRYAKGYDAPDVPEERHTCCQAHWMRYERDREQSKALKKRLKAERKLIKSLEALENR